MKDKEVTFAVWGLYEKLIEKNYLFKNSDAGIGDDLLKPFQVLYKECKKNNIQLVSLDQIQELSNINGVILIDYPNETTQQFKNLMALDIPKYLIALETNLVYEQGQDTSSYKQFDKVFSWNDDFNGKQSIKICIPQNIEDYCEPNREVRKKGFCALIAGNKVSNHKLELYSERKKVINWFQDHHPEKMDLYGIGWDRYTSTNRYINGLVRKLGLSSLLATNYPSYKGAITSKNAVLCQYMFSICYENVRDIPGYITEKIFDCFFAGCVPIYWGANNIEEHIPKHCFIDKRDFSTYEELYGYMANMAEEEYKRYQDNIADFLNSEQAQLFSAEHFAETIVQTINKDLNCE
jgi:hypothetical protein